ncbi:hypothetical protein HGRIS_006998 [Hohenbuehelia grisea]|uniref:Cytochrome P450 n=1 Tax=Hohenbuehelia grisea TaxID=104357 RepID=A0ABR3JB97_9AGAR
MIHNPSVARKAQEQLDAVLGQQRLPNHDDRDSLPYIDAIFREDMRWRPPVPLGIPHVSAEDDIYQGFFIRQGSIVIANVRAMAHDAEKYPDPEKFKPERFLDESGHLTEDEMAYTFGFGRRICPGRYVADATVWLAIAAILTTFDIGPGVDEAGNAVAVADDDYTDGVIVHPKPFRSSLTPRPSKALRFLEDSL